MSDYQPDRVLDHEYDGIREYDNKLPNWWLYTLYGAIVFAVGYWLYYHTYKAGPLPEQRWEMDMIAAAEAQLARMEGQELSDESLSLMAAIPAQTDAGKKIFTQFCVVCHSTQGEGNVGPNLTDAFWIHGPRPLDIHETITYGVTEKGMAAWGNQLGPTRVQQVTAYVLILKNTDVAGKAPEGKHESEWEVEASEGAPADGTPAAGETAPDSEAQTTTPGQTPSGGTGT